MLRQVQKIRIKMSTESSNKIILHLHQEYGRKCFPSTV